MATEPAFGLVGVVGKNLDTATGKLDSEGIQFAVDSNGKHAILKFDWCICLDVAGSASARDRTGGPDPGHFSCGA